MTSLTDIYRFENKLSKLFNYWCIYSNYAIVKSGDKWGVLNMQMNWLLKNYDKLQTLIDNPPLITYKNGLRHIDLSNIKAGIYDFFIAKKNNKYGIIDINENILIDFVYGDYLNNITSQKVLTSKRRKLNGLPALMDMSFDDISFMHNGQAGVCINKKWGVVNDKGKWIIKAKYDRIYDHFRDYYIVKTNGKVGIIDNKENIILPFKYNSLQNFYPYLIAKLKGKYGIITINGDILTEIKYDFLNYAGYGENKYLSAYKKNEDKFGLINSYGNIILPFIYDGQITIYNGIAIARKKDDTLVKTGRNCTNSIENSEFDNKNYLYGAVNLKNEVVIPFKYKGLDFISNETLVATKKNQKKIIIDFSNKQVCKIEFDDIESSEIGPNGELYPACLKNKYGFIDKFGNVKINFKYRGSMYWFENGLIAVTMDGNHWGLIDKNDNLIIPYEYTDSDLFITTYEEDEDIRFAPTPLLFQIYKDVIFAPKKGKYGIIDRNNNVISDFIFDSLGPFTGKWAWANLDKKYGFIDKKGKVIEIENF